MGRGKKHSPKLIFLYDHLMVKSEQEMVRLDMQFLAPGICKGNMLHYSDRVKQYMALNPKGNKMVYGGIFLIKEYEIHRDKLTAYYNSQTGLYGLTTAQSFYDFRVLKVRPIKFNRMSDLEKCTYEVGDYIDCITPVVNTGNPLIRKYVKGQERLRRYHLYKRIDKENFIQMIKENKKGLK